MTGANLSNNYFHQRQDRSLSTSSFSLAVSTVMPPCLLATGPGQTEDPGQQTEVSSLCVLNKFCMLHRPAWLTH